MENGNVKYYLVYIKDKLINRAMKFRIFWDVAPYILVRVETRFRGAYCLHHQGDNNEGSMHL
jgi:hypothetical protein